MDGAPPLDLGSSGGGLRWPAARSLVRLTQRRLKRIEGRQVHLLSSKHRLSRRRALDVADLADQPLLLLHRSFGSREWFEAACNLAHFRPRVLLESAAPHTLIALTGVGYGVAARLTQL
jgi:LysR substrate binding domain-containing protein